MSAKNQSVLKPDLVDVMNQMKRNIFKTLNVAKIGTINSFDPTKKTAEIQVVFSRFVGNVITQFPVLVDCPVFTLQGGGASLKFPIAPGDQALVIFCDRDIDLWFQTGQPAVPNTDRAHDISDAIALVGLNSLASSLTPYPANAAEMEYQGAKLGMKESKITAENGTGTLLAAIEALIDTIKAVSTVSGGPLTAGSIATLEAQKLVFEGLLNS